MGGAFDLFLKLVLPLGNTFLSDPMNIVIVHRSQLFYLDYFEIINDNKYFFKFSI